MSSTAVVDPDQVVKALEQRQSVSKKNYDKQSRDLPPLEVGDHTYCRINKGVSIEETEGR